MLVTNTSYIGFRIHFRGKLLNVLQLFVQNIREREWWLYTYIPGSDLEMCKISRSLYGIDDSAELLVQY